MKELRVPLDNGSSLLLQWSEGWNNLEVYYQNKLLGYCPDAEALKLGKSIHLPDGEPLTLVLREDNLEIWYRGADLISQTRAGEVDHFQRAVNALQVVGVIQLIVAPVIIYQFSYDFRWSMVLGLAIAGALILGLSYWAKKTGNKTTFWIGIACCIPAFLLWPSLLNGGILSVLAYFLYKGTQAPPPLTARQHEMDETGPLDQNM